MRTLFVTAGIANWKEPEPSEGNWYAKKDFLEDVGTIDPTSICSGLILAVCGRL